MDGHDFRQARFRLGYTLLEMTLALGLAPGSKRTVRRYEQELPVPPRLADRVRELLAEHERGGRESPPA